MEKGQKLEGKKMQVVILTGGEGTRLRPLTHTVPKPMVRVCGKPFLEHVLELVKSFGLIDVLILASYLGKQIEDYFGDGSCLGMSIKYSYEKTPLGTGGALKNAEEMLAESFILLNGDTLLPVDYRKLISRFQECDKTGLIVAYSNAENIARSNLRIGDGDVILSYNKESEDGMTHIDAGAIVLKKEILELIPGERMCSLEKEIFDQLIANDQLQAFRTDKRFYDIGSINGLKCIEQVLG